MDDFNLFEGGNSNLQINIMLYVFIMGLMFIVGAGVIPMLMLVAFVYFSVKDNNLFKILVSCLTTYLILFVVGEAWDIIEVPIRFLLGSLNSLLDTFKLYELGNFVSSVRSFISTTVSWLLNILRFYLGVKFIKDVKKGSYKINKYIDKYI